ncbi:hypothetical protein BDW71DRAFT_202197 [Aspergillus fruticulosus]
MSSSSVQVTRPLSSAGTGKDVANTGTPGNMSFDTPLSSPTPGMPQYLNFGTDWDHRHRRISKTTNGWHSSWTTEYFGHVSDIFTVLAQDGLVEVK